jgi:hypothetical protein
MAVRGYQLTTQEYVGQCVRLQDPRSPHLEGVGHHHLLQHPHLSRNAGEILPRRICVRSHIGGDLVEDTPLAGRRDVEEFPPKFQCLVAIWVSNWG